MAAGVNSTGFYGQDLSAPTLLLLPGLDGSGTLFSDFVSELPPTLAVVVAKYPTEQILSYLELVPFVSEIVPSGIPFVLVAESFSTPLAVKFAATRPQNLVGMVMCAGFVTNPAGNWTPLVRALTRRAMLRITPPSWILQHFVMGNNPTPSLEARFRKAIGTADTGVMAARLRAVLECDEKEDLGRTKTPLLYIQAERDRLVPRECGREIQLIRPDTLLVSIPDAPHLVLQREPRKCAEAIVRFIQEIDCQRFSI